MELTHASFFSGVGGLDLGLERAGWRTVSFSEIDPYASAVLAERWPGVPNLGDILAVQELEGRGLPDRGGRGGGRDAGDWRSATLWSGGFPCQDLSVAGKRRGFAGERSSLAFAFLDLVERHRPPAILLENVPGLLSSHGGRDLGRLLGEMGKLGYGWAYRILDARFFGVPQRRRRVFIVGLHAGTGLGADSAAAVLSVGTRCGRHPATGHATGEGAAGSVDDRADIARAVLARQERNNDNTQQDYVVGTLSTDLGHHGAAWGSQAVASGHVIADGQHGSSPDPGGVRAADGLAGRLDDSEGVVQSIPTQRIGTDDNDAQAGFIIRGRGVMDDPLLPLGLDSHRYRCCGNGVVSSVSEWVGLRLAEALS